MAELTDAEIASWETSFSPRVRVLVAEVRRLRAALERAEEVAGQGCEFCDAMVDDWGEERDGGREPHAHWWACGRCWNAGAQETSTIIGHLSELLDAALERIPELERELKAWECYEHDLKRVEAERDALQARAPSEWRRWHEGTDDPGPAGDAR